MDLTKLLEAMSKDINSLTMAEKMMGCLVVAVLAMGIVFAVLILLQFIIKLMNKMVGEKPKEIKTVVQSVQETETVVEESKEGDLVAAISAAVAASLGTSMSNIIVRKIERHGEDSSWAAAGRAEQMR